MKQTILKLFVLITVISLVWSIIDTSNKYEDALQSLRNDGVLIEVLVEHKIKVISISKRDNDKLRSSYFVSYKDLSSDKIVSRFFSECLEIDNTRPNIGCVPKTLGNTEVPFASKILIDPNATITGYECGGHRDLPKDLFVCSKTDGDTYEAFSFEPDTIYSSE